MSKRNITYVKPNEPKFLRKLKEEIGYKEGPTVDTKRELDNDNKDFGLDLDDEQPQVVVLKAGDLTAEEVAEFNSEKEAEEEVAADLSAPIVFKTPINKDTTNRKRNNKTLRTSATSSSSSSSTSTSSSSSSAKRTKSNKSLLSFDEEDED